VVVALKLVLKTQAVAVVLEVLEQVLELLAVGQALNLFLSQGRASTIQSQ
jgi:hypothetical protein